MMMNGNILYWCVFFLSSFVTINYVIFKTRAGMLYHADIKMRDAAELFVFDKTRTLTILNVVFKPRKRFA